MVDKINPERVQSIGISEPEVMAPSIAEPLYIEDSASLRQEYQRYLAERAAALKNHGRSRQLAWDTEKKVRRAGQRERQANHLERHRAIMRRLRGRQREMDLFANDAMTRSNREAARENDRRRWAQKKWGLALTHRVPPKLLFKGFVQLLAREGDARAARHLSWLHRGTADLSEISQQLLSARATTIEPIFAAQTTAPSAVAAPSAAPAPMPAPDDESKLWDQVRRSLRCRRPGWIPPANINKMTVVAGFLPRKLEASIALSRSEKAQDADRIAAAIEARRLAGLLGEVPDRDSGWLIDHLMFRRGNERGMFAELTNRGCAKSRLGAVVLGQLKADIDALTNHPELAAMARHWSAEMGKHRDSPAEYALAALTRLATGQARGEPERYLSEHEAVLDKAVASMNAADRIRFTSHLEKKVRHTGSLPFDAPEWQKRWWQSIQIVGRRVMDEMTVGKANDATVKRSDQGPISNDTQRR